MDTFDLYVERKKKEIIEKTKNTKYPGDYDKLYDQCKQIRLLSIQKAK